MDNLDICKALPGLLIPWYRESRRDLPWRADKEPYHVWLSEIMLQQTRVEAVKGYYARFLEALPDIKALANCPYDQLHKLWEGLGYYSRVRNLKKAAQAIQTEHGGVFPGEYSQVRSLPGIGDYTAGAICSICYDLPTPAVDGNVMRLLSRLLADSTPIDEPKQKKYIHDLLAKAYPENAGDFTQALMELGATLCGPNRKPDCGRCPCRAICRAKEQGLQETLPVKLPKRGRREEEKTVFIAFCDGKYALSKRPNTGLLAGLWEFPHAPGKLEAQQALSAAQALGLAPKNILRQLDKEHIFTHIRWDMRGVYLEAKAQSENFVWMTPEEIEAQAALPTAFRQFWEEIQYV